MGEKLLRRAAGRYMKDAFLLTKPCQDHRTIQEGNGIFILGKREGFYSLGQQDTDDVLVFPYTLQRYKQAGIIASIHFRIIYQNDGFACKPAGNAQLQRHFRFFFQLHFQTGNQTVRLGRVFTGILQHGLSC